MITLPGLIDAHVHLRDPGQTHKEDFRSGTEAALAGGFTFILDMPNNAVPISTANLLAEKKAIASQKAVCDIGFYLGSTGDNIGEFAAVRDSVFGLKLYLNATTGNYLIDPDAMIAIFEGWHCDKPILVHAEEQSVAEVIATVKLTNQRTHFCHISTAQDLRRIMTAKQSGLPVTCGVTPHHLFLTDEWVKQIGPFARVKPPLATKKDQDFLWQHLAWIDIVESDHAPHTTDEKLSSTPPFGMPGLETTLPLLITAVHDKRITLEDVIDKCCTKPSKIFNIPDQKKTKVLVEETHYKLENKSLHTKCKWTPFEGMKVSGRVTKVILRGETVFENGTVTSRAGSGIVF